MKDAKEIQNTVLTDDTEENRDKVMETFNFFDPDTRDKGGGGDMSEKNKTQKIAK